jgi:hypothetical protein
MTSVQSKMNVVKLEIIVLIAVRKLFEPPLFVRYHIDRTFTQDIKYKAKTDTK